MVGDTPESDILGGMNAGMDTCWLNVDNRPAPAGITPQYQVESMAELECLLLSEEYLLKSSVNATRLADAIGEIESVIAAKKRKIKN